eukprot:gene7019-9459_t
MYTEIIASGAGASVDAPADAPLQDERSLLYPLFITSFLIDDLLADNGDFGGKTVILASASSRTSLGLAWLLKQSGRVKVVGLTSPRNKAFVESLGYYDQVVLYDDLDGAPVETPAVLVDFAGDPVVRAAVHKRFGDDLAYSCLVGATHWEARSAPAGLPGPKPAFFFAPDRIVKRRQDWGPGGLESRYGEAWDRFVGEQATSRRANWRFSVADTRRSTTRAMRIERPSRGKTRPVARANRANPLTGLAACGAGGAIVSMVMVSGSGLLLRPVIGAKTGLEGLVVDELLDPFLAPFIVVAVGGFLRADQIILGIVIAQH